MSSTLKELAAERGRAQGRAPAAARLIGASGYARQVVGATIWPGMQSIADNLAAAVAGALGPAAFAAATAAGARMRIPDALRYGLAATAAKTTSDPAAERQQPVRDEQRHDDDG